MSDTPTPDYGEPWKFNQGEPSIESRDDDAVLTGIDYEIDDAKIQRAVSCVNACAGMTDPAAEIAMLKLARERALDAVDAFEEERDELRSDVAALLNALPNGAHDVTEGVGTILAMRKAINEAQAAIEDWRLFWKNNAGALSSKTWADGFALDAPTITALAKLKPFTAPA
jgi:hypothetical protein